jgi:hypothetical protein
MSGTGKAPEVRVVGVPSSRAKFAPPVVRPGSPASVRTVRVSSPNSRLKVVSEDKAQHGDPQSSASRALHSSTPPTDSPQPAERGPSSAVSPSRSLFESAHSQTVQLHDSALSSVEQLQRRLHELQSEARIVAARLSEEETRVALAARVAELEQTVAAARVAAEAPAAASSVEVLRRRLEAVEAVVYYSPHSSPPSPGRARSLPLSPHVAAIRPAAAVSFSPHDLSAQYQSPYSSIVEGRSHPSGPTGGALEDYCLQAARYASTVLPFN